MEEEIELTLGVEDPSLKLGKVKIKCAEKDGVGYVKRTKGMGTLG